MFMIHTYKQRIWIGLYAFLERCFNKLWRRKAHSDL